MSTNRIDTMFAQARTDHKKLLCPFLTAGYPSLDATVELLQAAERAMNGRGMIELGIPFSDPIADGPTIQESYTKALSAGTTVDRALACVRQARAKGVKLPIVAMVSFSIIFKRGSENFAKACVANGLDGLVLPDIPLEEAPAITQVMNQQGLKTALLVAPSTPTARRELIVKHCTGFIYYLSVAGITGERKELPPDIAANILSIKKFSDLPICVGFGIGNAAQVKQVTAVADGAIVGSAIIRRLTENPANPVQAAETFIRQLATGLS